MDATELAARIAIGETVARYNLAGDRNRVEDLAACFTTDGLLEAEGFPDFAPRGRQAIAQRLGRVRSEAATPRRLVRHHVTTSGVELLGPDEASGRSYFLVITEVGLDHAGLYRDRFRRVGDAWLIAHRRVRVEWWAPDSRFAPAE